MAISLAISITRFHSWCVNVVKSGREAEERVRVVGRTHSRSVSCEGWIIRIVKAASEEKITCTNLLFPAN